MGAYNFKKVFAPEVEAGRKRCTIRKRRKNGYVPKVGEQLALYTGMRTRVCRRLRRAKCIGVRPILIRCGENYLESVILDGRVLSKSECVILAKMDGFRSTEDFARFFFTEHGAESKDLYLIQW